MGLNRKMYTYILSGYISHFLCGNKEKKSSYVSQDKTNPTIKRNLRDRFLLGESSYDKS